MSIQKNDFEMSLPIHVIANFHMEINKEHYQAKIIAILKSYYKTIDVIANMDLSDIIPQSELTALSTEDQSIAKDICAYFQAKTGSLKEMLLQIQSTRPDFNTALKDKLGDAHGYDNLLQSMKRTYCPSLSDSNQTNAFSQTSCAPSVSFFKEQPINICHGFVLDISSDPMIFI